MDILEFVSHLSGTVASSVGRLREGARKETPHTEFNPCGGSNAHTGLIGVYRPVGDATKGEGTCPSSCPMLSGSCYATRNNTGMHTARALSEPSTSTAALAFVAAAKQGRLPVRLHVGGDFLSPLSGEVDKDYVYAICEIAAAVQRRFPRAAPRGAVWGFTYTHIAPSDFEPFRLVLAQHGIEVLYSGRVVAGGAVVASPEVWEALSSVDIDWNGVKPTRCLKQWQEGTTCASCRLCWSAREEGRVILFEPDHGADEGLESCPRDINNDEPDAEPIKLDGRRARLEV